MGHPAIDKIANTPPDKLKRKDMKKFMAILKEDEDRWRAGLPLLHAEQIAKQFGCDLAAVFAASQTYVLVRSPEGTA